MATCGHAAQAVGMAAALCCRHQREPRGVVVSILQRQLLRAGQYIPGVALEDPEDLARRATLTASSQYRLAELPPGGPLLPLDIGRAMLLPVPAGPVPAATFLVDVSAPCELTVEVRGSSRFGNFTPDVTLHRETIRLEPGGSARGFLESLLPGGLGLGVSGTRPQLAPPMPVQQPVDVGQRHALRGELLQFGTQLRGGEDLTLASRLLPFLQEALFLLPTEPSPASPSTPCALQTFRPLLVVLGDPEPDSLLGDAQRLSHPSSGNPADSRRPNRQTPLISTLIGASRTRTCRSSVENQGSIWESPFIVHPPSKTRQLESFVLIKSQQLSWPACDNILHAYLHLFRLQRLDRHLPWCRGHKLGGRQDTCLHCVLMDHFQPPLSRFRVLS